MNRLAKLITTNPLAGVLAAIGVAAGSLNLAAASPLEGASGDGSPSDRLKVPPQVPGKAADAKSKLDRSGRRRLGKASFYARMFGGRKMADGTPMQLQGNNAASKTLPLGTTAKVTNLDTGKTAVVTVQDRGPYVAGRIVDLSPRTAKEIGLNPSKGVTRVAVAPIAVPMPDGAVKVGEGALPPGTPYLAQNGR